MYKEKVLIIGGLGYIGSSLAKYLATRMEYDITVLDKRYFEQRIDLPHNVKLCLEDCRDFNYYCQYEHIINLAAYVGAPMCGKLPLHEVVSLNQYFVHDLTALLRESQTLYYPNTNSSYGSSGEAICTEESPMNPLSLYAETKDTAEKYVLDAGGIAFRLATVFGPSPRMRWDLLVNTFCFNAYYNKKLEIFEPHYRRNYVAVNDVCRAFEFAMKNRSKMKGQAYNLGMDKCNMTKGELANKVCDHFKAELVITDGVDSDKRDYNVSSEKLAKIGFKATTNIDLGLLLMEKYLESNLFDNESLKTMRNV